MSRRLIVMAAAASLCSGAGCSKDQEESKPTIAEAVPETANVQLPEEKSQVELILEEDSLTGAIQLAKPLMTDTRDDVSPGAVLFGAWAAAKMKWPELMMLPETKQALVMKDPDEERGKRICAKGKLIEIKAEKTDFGKFFEGGIFNGGRRSVVRFLAVGSTGELVAKHRARFCGIVIGLQSYANSGGGTTHTTYAVGMFDLPENVGESLE